MNSPWAMLITPATPKMMASPEAAMTRIATTPKPLRNWVMMDSNMETSKTDPACAAQARQIAQPVSARQWSPQPVDRRAACPAAVRAPIFARHGPLVDGLNGRRLPQIASWLPMTLRQLQDQ